MAKVALLIGISEYEPDLNPLPSAVKDVEAMRRVLVNPEMGDFAEANITVLKNPQRQEIEDAIYNLFTNRQKDDLLLFYFSGHGIKDERGKLYLSTRATKKQNGKLVTPSAVAANVLHDNINDSRSQRQVVILDCCFSGAIAQGMTVKDDGNVNVQEQLGGKGRAILTSSTSTQYSFEQQDSELSIYTRYLVEGIEKGAADKDGDGWISVDELHEYASTKVQEAAPAMTPKFYPVEEGYRIFIAKSSKDDPSLKYRKEAESRAKSGKGKFSVFAIEIMESKRIEWELSEDEAKAIREEVLQPYLEYERKRVQYEQALIRAVNEEYPFNEDELQEYQQYLGLRDEDIAAIKQRVLAPKQAEYERQQQEAERLRQEQEQAEYQRQQAELQKQQERTSSTPVFQPQFPPSIQTQPFEFEFATLTLKSSGFLGMGKTCEINRSWGQAEFFSESLGNGVVLEMIAIPGGRFLMGSPENEPERDDSESPQHTVTIQPFFMGKFAVTQAQWAAVAILPKVEIDLKPDPSNFKGAKRPVECVSWNDTIEFCARLSNKTGKTYRLPSEAEWEYACRARTTTPFFFGETITTDLANYNGNYTYGSRSKGKYRQQATDVGNFPPNSFGLFDMHGNTSEWCQDSWHKNYEGAPADGGAWINGNDQRLLRGGSWYNGPGRCRSAYRVRLTPGGRNAYFGFRVVCSPART
ncbi:SUMF1/EgtB/PvdOfamily nonheme iron enzyme [Komarekiella sp. 'clone 1']|uniref:SUMF1/EgtB/PvdOfamily nonheme iron enzyme n=1 Tax=Komarekiella delphini-convector SJRDD-AB1 TaxID=2593771 RepID=A0AA40T3Q1_9NOST|nr:SUMF1/EgtB/PvdO family nonheme iron enzyme [Komarekiella delphini-convector]MBD6620105.1 SUMF1/EgtB/PvdOfamily nonheme iron enzyme [Komarekiella delphini-convector SJRDD-AB1]